MNEYEQRGFRWSVGVAINPAPTPDKHAKAHLSGVFM